MSTSDQHLPARRRLRSGRDRGQGGADRRLGRTRDRRRLVRSGRRSRPGIRARRAARRPRRRDAEAFTAALDALATGSEDLQPRLEAAAAVPLEIAETAADVAEAGLHVAERCDGLLRADAAGAAALAAGAALAAAHLVRANLSLAPDDERVRRAFSGGRRRPVLGFTGARRRTLIVF